MIVGMTVRGELCLEVDLSYEALGNEPIENSMNDFICGAQRQRPWPTEIEEDRLAGIASPFGCGGARPQLGSIASPIWCLRWSQQPALQVGATVLAVRKSRALILRPLQNGIAVAARYRPVAYSHPKHPPCRIQCVSEYARAREASAEDHIGLCKQQDSWPGFAPLGRRVMCCISVASQNDSWARLALTACSG